MKRYIVLVICLVVVIVAARGWAAPYHILHKDGAIYDSETGWIVSTPPYYPGIDWAVDFLYDPDDGNKILHRDGAVWSEGSGWIITAPPYYPGTGYARALDSTTIYGQNDNNSGNGYGVWGFASAASGTNYGVVGSSASTSGRGVYGLAYAASGTTYGVYGKNDSTDGRGVYGLASATSGYTYGVHGTSASTSGRGVTGQASAISGTNYGVYGASNSTSGYDFYAGGSGTNYGPFTGAHEAKLAENFPQKVEPGLIVVATGQAQRRLNPDGTVNLSSTLPTIKLADQPHDKAVFGVLVAEATLPENHWYEAQEGERFATVNALGEGRVWVTDGNGAIEAGDYITTSAIPGYGQRQDDDLVHSYTLGKAIETVDWDTVTKTVKINGKTFKVYLLAVVYTSG